MQFKKSDFFYDGVDVDCSATPYDPSPAADAVAAEITRIRQTSDKPIFVLSGEVHTLPSHALLPFAFMLRSGLLTSTSPTALLNNFMFSVEFSHNAFANFSTNTIAKHVSKGSLRAFVSNDRQGLNLLSMLQTGGDKILGPHAHHYVYMALRQAKVSTIATDASVILDFLGNKYLDHRDEVAMSLVSDMAPHGLFTPKAFSIRNLITAKLVCQQGSAAEQVTWHQAGLSHLFGDQCGKYPYEASLSHQFATLIEEERGHAIVVFSNDNVMLSLEMIPPQARRFPGHVVTVCGLRNHVPRTHAEDYEEAYRVAETIILGAGPAGSGPLPTLPLLTEDYVSQVRGQVVKDFIRQAQRLQQASNDHLRKQPAPTHQSGPSGGP